MGSLFFFFLFFYLGFHVLEQTNLLARVLFPTLFLPNSILFSLQLRVLAACARFSDPFFYGFEHLFFWGCYQFSFAVFLKTLAL